MYTSKVIPKKKHLESVLFLIGSCGLFIIGFTDLHLRILNNTVASQAWENYIDGLDLLFVLYGAILLIFAAISFVYSLHQSTLTAQVIWHSKNAYITFSKEIVPSIQSCFNQKLETFWLLLALIIGSVISGYFLDQPMRYDESYTFLNFIDNGFSRLFYYPLPNNHVLYTILAKASTLVWGKSPVSIRLPAFLIEIFSILLLFCLCHRFNTSGILASISFAVFPFLILFSTNGRGYTLLIFFSLALTYVGTHSIDKKPSVTQALLLSIIAALGMFTMPSMLFPIAGILSWVTCILLMKGHPIRIILSEFVLPLFLMTILFTLILYTPVILISNGVETMIGNSTVQSQPWREFISTLFPHIQLTVGDFFRDIPAGVLSILIILWILGIFSLVQKHDWSTLLLLPLILLGSAIILFVQHRIPFTRTWIFIIPFILIYVDIGFTFVLKRFSYQIRKTIIIFCFAVGVIFAISLMSNNTITNYPDTGTFLEAQLVAKYLDSIMNTDDVVFARTPADWPTKFYLWYYNVEKQSLGKNIEPGETFFVVKKSRYSITDMTDKPVKKLLEVNDMALYQSLADDDK
jgi:hypothetical protein